jgi:hypothetical protein
VAPNGVRSWRAGQCTVSPSAAGGPVLPSLPLSVPVAFAGQAIEVGEIPVVVDEVPEAFAVGLARPFAGSTKGECPVSFRIGPMAGGFGANRYHYQTVPSSVAPHPVPISVRRAIGNCAKNRCQQSAGFEVALRGTNWGSEDRVKITSHSCSIDRCQQPLDFLFDLCHWHCCQVEHAGLAQRGQPLYNLLAQFIGRGIVLEPGRIIGIACQLNRR